MRLLLALVLLLALGACSSEKDSPRAEPRKAPTSSPSAPEAAPSTQPDASDSKACAEVRAGIDAFNAGDFETTVDHFELAVPLAEAQARTDSSKAADDLLEAVRYYAELAPEDYAESARSSPEFLKYKTITLGQCVTPSAPLDDSTGSPGVTT
jgi:hypothetical protein